jgi:dolichol-phosphate mannosyltransferase
MLYFVILAYNEEENLPRLLHHLHSAASSISPSFKIIVVNDGSTDGTARVADELSKTMPIHIEHHTPNKGVGEGFRTGFRSALSTADDEDVIVTLEADNTSDLSILPELHKKIVAGADVALASCYAPGGSVEGVPVARKLMSVAINHVMRLFFPISHAHTYSSFYRAYRSKVIRRAMDTFGVKFIESSGYTVAAEILFKLRRLGVTMDEVPMSLTFGERKGKSKMKVWATIVDYLQFLIREVRHEILHRSVKQERWTQERA